MKTTVTTENVTSNQPPAGRAAGDTKGEAAAHTPTPYKGHLERGPDRIYSGEAIRLDLAGYGGAVELGFEGCTMAENPEAYAAFIVRACNENARLHADKAALVEALTLLEKRMTETGRAFYETGKQSALQSALSGWRADIEQARAALAAAKEGTL